MRPSISAGSYGNASGERCDMPFNDPEKKTSYDKKRYEENREALKAKARNYRKQNAPEIKARRASHYIANREKILAYQRAHYCPAKSLARARKYRTTDNGRKNVIKASIKWMKKNPEKVRGYRRRASSKWKLLNPKKVAAKQRRLYWRQRTTKNFFQIAFLNEALTKLLHEKRNNR
jgi:hypothetical protein